MKTDMPEVEHIENGDEVEKRGCCDDGAAAEKESCCGKALRVWLIGANFITLLIGFTEIIMGIMVQSNPEWSFAGGTLGWLVIITGLFVFFVSFLGVYAGCKGARADCWMYVYALVLTIILCLQIAGAAIATQKEGTTNLVLARMEETWELYTTQANKEYLGLQFGCCQATTVAVIGGTGDGYADCSEKKLDTKFMATCEVYPVCVAVNGEALSQDNSGCGSVTYVNAVAVDNGSGGTMRSDCAVSGAWDAAYHSLDCAAYASAAIPLCTTDNTFDHAWYTALGGAEDSNLVDAGLNEAFVNCYGSIESWVNSNIMSAVIGLVIYILWQILLVAFSWLLACDCCNKGVSTEDSAVGKEYEAPGVSPGV